MPAEKPDRFDNKRTASAAAIHDDLRCPASGAPLLDSGEGWLATVDGTHRYPVVDGIPILVVAHQSLFAPNAVESPGTSGSPTAAQRHRLRAPVARMKACIPAVGRNIAASTNLAALGTLLDQQRAPDAECRVLVIGGGDIGEGMREFVLGKGRNVIETDVYIGPRTQIVCDGHDLPFRDHCFDAVVCQAVLEHVVDPKRVVSEIHRVLTPSGLVYSEVPFMQQVHEGAYDFTRYTHSGHRRLFRYFDEIHSGATGGPGMALAWSTRYFAMAFAARSRTARGALDLLASLLTFWLKYLDPYLAATPGGLDAAAGTFFLGRRRCVPRSDKDIVQSYNGAHPTPER